jgi:hypothetical protein
VAAWWKVLNKANGKIGNTERDELKAVFQEIFETPINEVVLDSADPLQGIEILAPSPPRQIGMN